MQPLVPLAVFVTSRGGAVHTSDARTHGYSARMMADAVAADDVRRVRRSWLISRDCDESTLRAIRAGGRLTCVTAARRMGLWVPSSSATDAVPHVGVDRTSSRVLADGLVLHWARGPSPTAIHAVIDAPINVLFHVARCLPRPDALAVWESALRTRAVDAAELVRVQWRSTAARQLADFASSLSDSGVETRFVSLMRSISVVVRQQVRIDGHRVDGLIGDNLVVQVDGFAHHQAADRRRDLREDARLVLRGYVVLRFDWLQVLFAPEEVVATVSAAIAQGLHRRGIRVPKTGVVPRTGR